MAFTWTRKDFPSQFEFGTATSAYQIEGSQFGECGLSHWDTFAQTPGNVVRGEDGRTACDHYHRWEQDLDLVTACGLDSYRFSSSWARVMPDGRGAVNQAGLDFYERLVDGLLARDIKPYLTLYHWELPAALADLGGWANPDIAHWFTDYAQTVMQRLGDRVHSTATFNEPWCVTWLSHFLGHHAPGLKDIRATAQAVHNLLRAHGQSVQALRAEGIDNLGIVLNFDYATPADDQASTQALTALCDSINNRLFIEPIFKQRYPDNLLDTVFAEHLPKGFANDMAQIAQPLDWLGINYYTRHIISASDSPLFPGYAMGSGDLPRTAMDWEIYPEGLQYFIEWAAREYSGSLPIYITENGMANPDQMTQGQVNDTQRIEFIEQHIQAVKRALANGAPVQGYFVWSLLDNYEWAFGYEKRFGMVHVDFDSLERTPKASWHALQAALQPS